MSLAEPQDPAAPYQEHHFSTGVSDVGIAFNGDRIWVCVNGIALLRAKVYNGKLFLSYTPDDLINSLHNGS